MRYKIEQIVEVNEKGELKVLTSTSTPLEDTMVEEDVIKTGEDFTVNSSMRKYKIITLGAKFSKKYLLPSGKDIDIVVNGFKFRGKPRTHNNISGRVDNLAKMFFDHEDTEKKLWGTKYINLDVFTEDSWKVRYDVELNTMYFVSESCSEIGNAINQIAECGNTIAQGREPKLDKENVKTLFTKAKVRDMVFDNNGKLCSYSCGLDYVPNLKTSTGYAITDCFEDSLSCSVLDLIIDYYDMREDLKDC